MRIKGKNSIGVVVIGAGGVSNTYLSFFSDHPETRLVAVADPNPAVRARVKETYPVQITSDYTDVLQREDIQLAVVCVPHHLHHPIVTDCLRAGKHVICEKPIAISLQEADDMMQTARECNRKLFVTLNMRFTAWARQLRKVLNEKTVGDIFMARAAYLGYETERLSDPNHWKGTLDQAGGGVLLDGGYHVVDLMNSWLGRATAVCAVGGQYVINCPHKGEDNIALLVEYESGAVGNLTISFTCCLPGCVREPTLIVESNLYATECSINTHYSWDTVQLKQYVEYLGKDTRQFFDLADKTAQSHCEHFLNCLIDPSKPDTTLLDARNALAVVEAAYKSLKTGRKCPVDWKTA